MNLPSKPLASPGNGALLRQPSLDTQALLLRPGTPTAAQTSAASVGSEALAPGAAAGFEAGYARGLAAGLKDAKVQTRKRVKRLSQRYSARLLRAHNENQALHEAATAQRLSEIDRLVAAFETALLQRVHQLETQALALCFTAVSRLIAQRLADPESLASLLAQAFEPLRSGAAISRVRLHPDDLRLLEQSETGRALRSRYAQADWQADPSLAAGACVIETPTGQFDTNPLEQLQQLATLWLEVPNERQARARAAARQAGCETRPTP